MKTKDFQYTKLPLSCLLLAIILLAASMAGNMTREFTDRSAAVVGRRIEKRLDILDRHMSSLRTDYQEDDLHTKDIPEDMVIYRYVNDSLNTWINQFSVINDDISSKLVFQRLTDLKSRITSPLSDIGEELSYVNLGPKWYVVKATSGPENETMIAGIEIKNTLIEDLSKTENGVSPKLKLHRKYTILPLNHSGGSPVIIHGKPLFKVIHDNSSAATFFDHSGLRWLAMLFFVFALIFYLAGHRTLKVYTAVVVALSVMMGISFLWALQMNGSSDIFSPSLYAEGSVLFSLGILLLFNTYILLLCLCTYIAKSRLSEIQTDRARMVLYISITIIAVILLGAYIHSTFSSLICNSNIPMELYRLGDAPVYSVLTYLSYISLALCIPLMLQIISPLTKALWSIRYDALSVKSLTIFSLVAATYFTVTSSFISFNKEDDRVDVWASRLSVDRDLSLEIQLRSIEEAIAADPIISSLANMPNTAGLIQNRINETYLGRARQNYDLSVMVIRDNDQTGQERFNNILRNGTPIAQGGRFHFITDSNGRSRYAGTFISYAKNTGITRILLEIEPNSNRDDKGYYSILGRFSQPGNLNLSHIYSYAKYKEGSLSSISLTLPLQRISKRHLGKMK